MPASWSGPDVGAPVNGLLMVQGIVLARPEALLALAVLVPVVAAHLYRKRRRRLEVAFVPLLREAVGPVRARGAWRRVREVGRLACRMVAVAALALALADPRPARALPRPVDLVVVIDDDVTTSVVEREGPRGTRRHEALDLAAAWVAGHPSAHDARVAVVLAAATPRVLVAPTVDREAARRALRAHDLGSRDVGRRVDGRAFVRGDLLGGVAVARTLKAKERALSVVVVSAREAADLASLADPSGGEGGLDLVGVGRTRDDRGFVDAALRLHDDGATFTVRLVVRNTADAPVTGALTWRFVDARGATTSRLPESPFDVPARGEVTLTRDVVAPKDGGELVVTLPPDVWSVNDVFAARLDRWRRPSVLVVHGGTPRPFLRALLEAMGDDLDIDASGFVDAEAASAARPRDVTIFDGAVPPSGHVGPRVYLAPFYRGDFGAAGSLPFRVGRRVDEPLVWRADTAHPLLRGVDLSTAWVARADVVEALAEGDPALEVLASVEGAPVLVRGGPSTAPFVALGLDADGSDLPLRAALPILLRNAVRFLYQAPTARLPAFVRVGEHLPSRTGEAVNAEAEGPLGRDGEAPRTDAGAWFAVVRGQDSGVVVGRTAQVVLDRSLDVTPARVAAPPPRAVAPARDDGAAWARALVALAGVLLLIDLSLGAAARTRRNFVGRSPIGA